MKNNLSRVAMSSVIGVMGGIALMNVSDRANAIIGWWLLYVLAAGVALAPQRDDRLWHVVLMAAFPALVPVLDAVVMHEVLRRPIKLSGAPLSIRLALTIFVVDWVAIWLFSYAHQLVIIVIEKAASEEMAAQIKNIEKTVRAVALCSAAIAMAIAALGYANS